MVNLFSLSGEMSIVYAMAVVDYILEKDSLFTIIFKCLPCHPFSIGNIIQNYGDRHTSTTLSKVYVTVAPFKNWTSMEYMTQILYYFRTPII